MKQKNKKSLILLFLLLIIFFRFISLAEEQPYVILISFDAFRWDYLNRGITPNIDKFRNEGVSAMSLRPVFPSTTFPNHLSIITGMYPENHGIISNNFKDPVTGNTFSLAYNSQKESKWYLSENFWTTAKRNGIRTASYFWPGSEQDNELNRPDYSEIYDSRRQSEQRLAGILNWLGMPYNLRPHFISAHFEETDTQGHRFGTNSPELNKSIARLDSLFGCLISGIENLNLTDSINIILLSDHGMEDVDSTRTINIDDLLRENKCLIQNFGAYMMLEPENGNVLDIFDILDMNKFHFSVYLKKNMPGHFHFSNNQSISSIILIAEPGWLLITNDTIDKHELKAAHGYDNNLLNMQGIFAANGPMFKSGMKTTSLWNIDIYPLLCKIYNLPIRSNIDGKLERIEFILKKD